MRVIMVVITAVEALRGGGMRRVDGSVVEERQSEGGEASRRGGGDGDVNARGCGVESGS